MFQPTFDASAEDHLSWDEFGYNDFLATMDGAPQQADEVLTQLSHLAAGGATMAGGASPAGGGATPAGRATPDAACSSQEAMATPSPDQLGPRVVRASDPWTYNRDHTWAGARAVRRKRGRRI
jgi:hypothetical protein